MDGGQFSLRQPAHRISKDGASPPIKHPRFAERTTHLRGCLERLLAEPRVHALPQLVQTGERHAVQWSKYPNGQSRVPPTVFPFDAADRLTHPIPQPKGGKTTRTARGRPAPSPPRTARPWPHPPRSAPRAPRPPPSSCAPARAARRGRRAAVWFVWCGLGGQTGWITRSKVVHYRPHTYQVSIQNTINPTSNRIDLLDPPPSGPRLCTQWTRCRCPPPRAKPAPPYPPHARRRGGRGPSSCSRRPCCAALCVLCVYLGFENGWVVFCGSIGYTERIISGRRLEKPAPLGNRRSMCGVDWLGVQMCGPIQSIWIDRTVNRSTQPYQAPSQWWTLHKTHRQGRRDPSGRSLAYRSPLLAGGFGLRAFLVASVDRRAARRPAGTPPLPITQSLCCHPLVIPHAATTSTLASDRDGSWGWLVART